MNAPPIVVTGMGALCAAGQGVEALWSAVERAAVPTTWAEDGRTPVCRVREIALPELPGPNPNRADRMVRLALAAAAEAYRDAMLHSRGIDPARIAVVVGTSRGPVEVWDASWRAHERGAAPGPTLLPNGTIACVSGALSVAFGARGPSMAVSATCASGAYAIATAAALLRAGVADVVLAGASDSPLHPALLAQYGAAGMVASHADPARACRPFDAARNGTVFGEGAGFLVLERGHANLPVRPRALLAGWGLASDARGRTATDPDGAGLVRAMQGAAAMAGVAPSAIGYVNAHGTGTAMNDEAEARALRTVFGADAGVIPCGSSKPVTGHCAGATPVLEAIVAIGAMGRGRVPPSANCDDQDPRCPIRVVRGAAIDAPIEVAMSNSLGFWGVNASLVFRRVPN